MQATSSELDKFLPAFLAAQKKMQNAVKDAKNPFFKSSYADLNAVREATIPVLNEHEIVVLQPIVVIDGRNYVETKLAHTSGQFISSYTEIKVKAANDPQAEGSGISYARRYGLQSVTGIGAADDDGESAMSRQSTLVKKTEETTPSKPRASFRPDTSKKVDSDGATKPKSDGWD